MTGPYNICIGLDNHKINFQKLFVCLFSCSGGALDANHMIRGKIADFQMWDRALSDKEVRSLGREAKGSLVTLMQWDLRGSSRVVTSSVTQLENFINNFHHTTYSMNTAEV